MPATQPIALKDGVFEVGRVEPADIIIPIPTVSSRHALLRVGAWPPAPTWRLMLDVAIPLMQRCHVSGMLAAPARQAAAAALPLRASPGSHACTAASLLSADGAKVMVTDLGSTNGTEVDGKELEAMANTAVPLGCEITFGGALAGGGAAARGAPLVAGCAGRGWAACFASRGRPGCLACTLHTPSCSPAAPSAGRHPPPHTHTHLRRRHTWSRPPPDLKP